MKSKIISLTSLMELNDLLDSANKGETEIYSFIPNITLLNSNQDEVPVLLVTIGMPEQKEEINE